MDEERLQVLRMVENGQISADQAAELLAALGAEAGAQPVARLEAAADAQPVVAPELPDMPWKRFWVLGALAGGALLVFGALILGLLAAADAARGWQIVCGWLPMLGGLGVALLAWWARGARWLYLRVQEEGERTVTITFPVPLTLAAWAVRIARPFVPKLRDTAVDELILALRDSGKQGPPMMIDVDDSDEGEKVQVYLG